MIDFANAKINIGLQITGKRSDGYHFLESLFVPISLYDIIEIVPRLDGKDDSLIVLGDIDTGATCDNLVLRAVRRLRAEYDFPPVSIVLKKQIPSGAGLGGGSSDATTTLKMLCRLFSLPIKEEDLCRIALSLGADCPFFVANHPMIVRGVGEELDSAPELDFSSYRLLLVKPTIHDSTAEAFRGLKGVGGHELGVADIVVRPMTEWRDCLVNDFEESLFPKYSELSTIKQQLYDMGAVYSSLTGSGSAIYGFFEHGNVINTEVLKQSGTVRLYECRVL